MPLKMAALDETKATGVRRHWFLCTFGGTVDPRMASFMKRESQLASAALRYTLIIILVIVIPTGTIWGVLMYHAGIMEIQRYRKMVLDESKATTRSEVENAVDYIRMMQSKSEERVRQGIKERVDEAHIVATHIYETYKDTKSQEEIQRMIVETMRPIRFNQGRGYYFTIVDNGVLRLLGDRPELEGENLLKLPDPYAKVVGDMIRIDRENKSGFYSYRWSKPGQKGMSFDKISYIRHFEPYDWIIGTGEYLDDMEKIIQKEAIERLSQVRFTREGYLFVVDNKTKVLLVHRDPRYVNLPVKDIKEIDGVELNRRQVEAARHGDGFTEYVFIKPGRHKAHSENVLHADFRKMGLDRRRGRLYRRHGSHHSGTHGRIAP
jgi:hypothetical protein